MHGALMPCRSLRKKKVFLSYQYKYPGFGAFEKITMTKPSVVEESVNNIKSVAIIGAGPSGAGALKALIQEKKFDKVQAFEKRPCFGGLWNYTPETDTTCIPIPCEEPVLDIQPVLAHDKTKYIYSSPAYNFLDTNVPKDIMTYADFPFPEDTPVFPHRSEVWKYMNDYSKELYPYVQFNTKVVHVELLDNNKWKVVTRKVVNENQGARVITTEFPDVEEIYDAVIIANGNYDVPYIPNRDGMKEWSEKYPGSIIHVKAYRQPEDYADLKGEILVVGNSASGGDLAYQLAVGLKRPIYKSKRSENSLPAGHSDYIVDRADIKRFNAAEKLVEFTDGTKLENVDKVIFATGYLKSYPFLQYLNKTDKPLLTDGFRVHGNYQHVILYNYPNLAILGLARYVLPTRAAETQGCWLAKIWSGRIPLPSYDEMKAWEEGEVAKRGSGTKFHDLLFPNDVHYSNLLNNQILDSVKHLPVEERGLIPKIWDKEQTAIRGSIKPLKEAYIKYKEETGIAAKTYQELIEANVIDKVMISDEELEKAGFKW